MTCFAIGFSSGMACTVCAFGAAWALAWARENKHHHDGGGPT